MKPVDLVKAAPDLSCISFCFTSRQRMATLAPRQIPHPVFRSARIGTLRRAGFAVHLTDEEIPGHCTVVVPSPLTTEDLERLDSIFGPPTKKGGG